MLHDFRFLIDAKEVKAENFKNVREQIKTNRDLKLSAMLDVSRSGAVLLEWMTFIIHYY